jgi:hydrogenase/urease accessory protein HupE
VRIPYAAIVALSAALLPAVAQAHLVTTGLGPVYDGISHVLVSPDDLVPVIAMALLAGLNGPAAGRRTLFVLTGAWLTGGVAGLLVAGPAIPGAATTASFLVLGVLVAADRRLAPATVALVASALGILHGWLNGAGIAASGREALALAGIGAAVFVVVALVAAFVSSLKAGWSRVAVRVAGSWVAAIGLLMLGWGLRGAP